MSQFAVLPDAGQAGSLSYRIDYRPAFPIATLGLEPGASVSAQAGAMVSMSTTVELKSEMAGGLMGALKRSVTGRSAFVSSFTAAGGAGEVVLAPSNPGDLIAVHVAEGHYTVASAAYLASDPALNIDTQWSGLKGMLGADSLLVMRVSGTGLLLLTAFGALHTKTLAAGEKYIVDTGHLIAWDSAMQLAIRKATASLFRSATSGEGFVAEVTGPGTLLMQTRNLEAFASALVPFLPSSSSNS